MPKYKMENWNKIQWKGTKRETTIKIQVLVKRDKNGHFAKNTKNNVIKDFKIKAYPSGIYYVATKKGKVIARQKRESRAHSDLWDKSHFETIPLTTDNKQLHRTSYVLNHQMPLSKSGYFGFRIVAFGYDVELLINLKDILKKRLISWMEEYINYKQDEWVWFDSSLGYEKPTITNAHEGENNKYYMIVENNKGMVIKERSGSIGEL